MKPKSTLRSFLAIAGYAALTMSYAHAASATWDGSTDQTWANGTNWSGDAAPGLTTGITNTDVATFGTTGSGIVTVDANRNVSGINFNANSSAFTLSGGNLLLSNAGTIQTSGAGSAHTDTINSAIELQGNGGSASFTGGSSTATRLLVIGGGVTGVSTGLNVTTLNLNGANAGNNAVNGIIADGSGGGKLALVKSDAGKWVLGVANTYSGGTVLNAGQITVTADTNLGDLTGDVTFSGSATLSGAVTYNSGRTFTLNSGALATISGAATIAGQVTGSGGIVKSDNTLLTFTASNNNFTGAISISSNELRAASLSDGVGDGAITLNGGGLFSWTGGAQTFDDRQFVLAGTGQINNMNTGAGALTITNDMGFSGTGTRLLKLSANLGSQLTLSGAITDNDLATSVEIKSSTTGANANGGTVALSGTNTYSGTTTISTNSNAGNTLPNMMIFQGKESLSPNTSVSYSRGNSGFFETRFLDDGVGTIDRSTTNFTYATSGTPVFFVGNNNTVNGGNSAGTTTGNTFALGNLTLGNSGLTYDITGANGYKLRFNDVNLPTANGAVTATFNPTTASLILAGTVRQASSVNTGAMTLTLGGSATANAVNGDIMNSADGTPRVLSLAKSGGSTWTLAGTNSYTGTTNIAAGTLRFEKAASLYTGTTGSWTASNINVKSGGTLAFNVGGTGEFSTGNVTTLLTNLAASSSATNGMNSGSNFGFDTTNAPGGTFTISDVIADSTGASGGARGLTKLGTGSLLLTNSNTYTGATTVSAGTLLVNGSLNSGSAVAVNGGNLGGSGTIGGTVTVAAAGSIAPGASAGTLAITGGLNVSAPVNGGAGKLKFELGSIAASDKITVGGTLTIGTAFLGFSDFEFSNLPGLENGTYTLISYNTLAASNSLAASGLSGTIGAGPATGTLQLNTISKTIELVVAGAGGGGAYEAWAGGAAFNADANGDGVKNGLAFLLGATNPSENAIGRLPTVTHSGGKLILNFNCLPIAARGTAALKVAHSTNLGSWTRTTNVVPDATNAVPDNNVTFVVGVGPVGPPALKSVTATIGSAAAAGGRLFGRLEANP